MYTSDLYLSDLVCPYNPARALRSANNNLLTVVRTHVKAGDNSVVVAAATLWNALPNNIKTSVCLATFKARLKTHFFLTVLMAKFNVYLLL